MAGRGARGESVGRDRILRSGQNSIGRVAADWETGADDAGNSKCCSCSYELVAVFPEAFKVAGGKSINEIGNTRIEMAVKVYKEPLAILIVSVSELCGAYNQSAVIIVFGTASRVISSKGTTR